MELNAISDGRKAMTTVQEKWRIMNGHYLNTVGEPRSEILNNPHLF